jgi:hypothetical protein
MNAELSDFPQFRLRQLIGSSFDLAVQLRLFRRAAEAWRHTSRLPRPGQASSMWFVQSFQRFWNLLPADEARELLGEIVYRASSQPPNWSGIWDPEGTIRIDSSTETLFSICSMSFGRSMPGWPALCRRYIPNSPPRFTAFRTAIGQCSRKRMSASRRGCGIIRTLRADSALRGTRAIFRICAI